MEELLGLKYDSVRGDNDIVLLIMCVFSPLQIPLFPHCRRRKSGQYHSQVGSYLCYEACIINDYNVKILFIQNWKPWHTWYARNPHRECLLLKCMKYFRPKGHQTISIWGSKWKNREIRGGQTSFLE